MLESKETQCSSGDTGKIDKLSFEQRKELLGLLKRMLPPVPSRGIIDIRFSFWFFRHFYFILIMGKDTRDEFKSLDKGNMDRGITAIAKVFTYLFLLLMMLITLLSMLYLIKSYLGINIFQERHLLDVVRDLFR